MNYFVFFYRVVIDNNRTFSGKTIEPFESTVVIGSEIVSLIEKGYRGLFPDCLTVDVHILKVRQTTLGSYNAFLRSKKSRTIGS